MPRNQKDAGRTGNWQSIQDLTWKGFTRVRRKACHCHWLPEIRKQLLTHPAQSCHPSYLPQAISWQYDLPNLVWSFSSPSLPLDMWISLDPKLWWKPNFSFSFIKNTYLHTDHHLLLLLLIYSKKFCRIYAKKILTMLIFTNFFWKCVTYLLFLRPFLRNVSLIFSLFLFNIHFFHFYRGGTESWR